MGILQFENFSEWNGFSEINLVCMRLQDDDSKLRVLATEVPEDLRQEFSLYLLNYSITRQSDAMLKIATELGVFEIPGVKHNLEIAVTIRDRIFTQDKAPNEGHLEILRQSAERLGEAFAIDSLSAVYNNEFARIRSKATSFADGTEKLATFTANLKLWKRFTPAQFLLNPDIGNIGIRHIRAEAGNFRSGNADALYRHLQALGELEFDDFLAIASVIKDDPLKLGNCMPRQIDAGVCQSLPGMSRDVLQNLELALKVRPTNTLMTLVTLSESQFSRFVSYEGVAQYLTIHWLTAENASILQDQNFLDLHELFNNRLLANPYLPSVFERYETLAKPWDVTVTLAMMLPQLKEKGFYVDLSKPYGLKTLATSLSLLKTDPRHAEVVRVGHESISAQLNRNALHLYAKMVSYESFKHMKPVSQMEKADMFRFVAVRVCAELHQPNNKLRHAEADKIKPIGQFLGMKESGLEHKEALLALVETYDEATILGALKGYKAGIKPLIELGVLDRKHMALLPAKDRGEMLENAMGL